MHTQTYTHNKIDINDAEKKTFNRTWMKCETNMHRTREKKNETNARDGKNGGGGVKKEMRNRNVRKEEPEEERK